MLLRLAIALPLLFALGSSSAWAQRKAEITPFIAYRFAGGVTLEALNTDLNIDSNVSWGFTFDVNVTETVAVEFLYSHQKSLVKAKGGIFGPSTPLDDLSTDYYHGGLLFHFNESDETIRPFILFSLGATNFNPDVEGLDSTTKFSFGFGGGVKFFASEHVGARLEFRGYSTNTDLTQTGWICGYITCALVTGSQYVWQGELQGGLILAF
jgi:opacity protein-like surface antigen